MSKFLDSVRKNTLTILALTISLFTLFMYVRQTNILVQQTKASSWPYLVLGKSLYQSTSYSDSSLVNIDTLEIYVTNKGTGPAIIERAIVKINDEEIKVWYDLYKVVSVPDSIEITHVIRPIYQEVIMPGEKILLINWNGNPEMASYINSKIQNLEIAICYQSIHGDYWTVSRKDFVGVGDISRIQSKDCNLNAKTYFVQ